MSEKISCIKVLTVVLALATSVFVGVASVGAQTSTLSSVTPLIVPEGQDGELDHTFGANDGDGVDGLVELNEDNSWLNALLGATSAQQSDGKILTVSLSDTLNIGSLNNREFAEEDNLVTIARSANWDSTIRRRNYDGSVDSTFGQDGTTSLNDLIGANTLVLAIALQSDGKIVLTGLTQPDNQILTTFANDPIDTAISIPQNSPFVMRLQVDGSLDTSFGNNGFIELNLAEFDFGVASDVLVQTDGKIVVAGCLDNMVEPTSDLSAQAVNTNVFFVSRLLADGSLDTTFADAGTYVADNSFNCQWISRVFQQSDGKVVIIGNSFDTDTQEVNSFAARLTSLGTLDASYGDEGVTHFFTGSSNQDLLNAEMQSDNQLIVVNNISTNDYFSAVIERITSDGDIDQSFGTDGNVIVGDGESQTYLFGLAIQPDGKIIATGITGITDANLDTTTGELITYRIRNDGTFDETFGEFGKVSFDLIPNLLGTSVIVQPNGQLLIFGSKINNDSSAAPSFMLRLNSVKPISVTGVAPSRLFDTRVGSPQGTISVDQSKYGKSKELRIKVAGASGLPEYGIGAVTLNVTVTEPEDSGYITVYPCGTRPLASNLNFIKNQTVSASVTTAVSRSGEVCIFASAFTNLVADVNSWSAPNAGYAPLSPQRLLDTRALSPQGAISVVKKKYGADSELRVKVAGSGGFPGALMSSVSLNVTVTEPETEGFLTVYPCGTRPVTSNLNFVADQTISTSVTSPVSDDGEICIYSSAMTNLIADGFGWFVEGAGVTPVGPTRLVDTRVGSPQGAISVTKKKYGVIDDGNRNELRLPLLGVAELPEYGIGTVQLTVTVTDPAGSGFITIYPCETFPLASNLNYVTGQTIATAVTAQVSADGEICIYSNQSTNIIVDINGWGNLPRYACDGSILEVTQSERVGIMCR